MKKTLAVFLTLAIILTFTACEKKATNETENSSNAPFEAESLDTADNSKDANLSDKKSEDNSEAKPVASEKPIQSSAAAKPETKPQAGATDPELKPEPKPETKPEEKVEEKADEKPQTSTPVTLGNILLADFKARAAAGDVLTIAEALIQNSAIKFSGSAMSVEPGLLSGFGNNEITGFKSGAAFMPIIGSIPFVGYVFELENAADVSGFISKLKASANLRWNVCVEADEMVTGSVGSKVFFVMCPTSLED